MNGQIHYAWIHELQVQSYQIIQKFGEEFPSIYAFMLFSTLTA